MPALFVVLLAAAAAALAVLMGKDGFADLLKRAVAAAAKRSRELSS